MRTEMSTPPAMPSLEACPQVYLEVVAIPCCRICGFKAEPLFGCIPRMESHLAVAHGLKPSQGKAWWIDCSVHHLFEEGR